MWRNISRLKISRSSLLYRGRKAKQLCTNNDTNSRPSVLEAANQLKSGDRIGGYTVDKVVPVPELQLVSVQLTHNKTGAEHLHIARQDSNNVFSVGFRTTPMDSTGVPHILEHTVLCGSHRFPCRDPFFNMLNRSLATFMNAFTASDFTMYPFSTQNEKDFSNLLSVYLDAVFFPRLTELDFWQEGWRLEPINLTDPKSPLTFKGVVFNEMKGALSTAESLYLRHAQMKLLPSHTYGNNSAGDPICIPDLTWEKLKEFHAGHYHPSNSRFYTYGDMPLAKHLESIEEQALRQFSKIDPGTDIPSEPRWTQPRHELVTCPPDPMAADPEKQTITSLNYLLGSTLDPFEGFVLSLLSSLLVSGPTSPFYQALIEPNIGSDYSPGVGYDGSTRDSSFSIGLQGIRKGDVDRVTEIIHNTIDKIIEEGFDSERIEAALHRVELGVKHQSSNFGLGLISNMMSVWNHGGDPADFLQINKTVDRFKECLEDGSFLQDKMRQCFKDNTHCLTLTMSLDEDYDQKQEALEQEKLKRMVSCLSDEEKTVIYNKDLQLAAEQNSLPDVSVLPRMHLSDIDPKIKPVKFEETVLGGVPVQISEQPTNGMTYFRAISSTTDIPDELKPYLPLFCFVLTKMGAGSLDYKEMAQQIELATGGLSVSAHICSHHTDPNTYEQGVMFSSYCLDKNLPRMFYLWEEVFARPTLTNVERLRTLINMMAADLGQSIAHSGHSYALSLAESSLTPSAKLGELLGGLSQVLFMKELAETEDLEPVIQKLSTIAYHVLDGSEFRCVVNMTSEAREPVQEALAGFLDTLSACRTDVAALVLDKEFQPLHEKTHFEMPFPVNYVSKCVTSVQYNHEDFPRLRVLAKILSSKFLHREIREKGGAYGSGAKVGGGVFAFYSYRDPNSTDTLSAFDEAVKWAMEGKFSDEDITEAKLSVFASVDKPVSPSSRGMAYFSQGITDEMRQTHRDRLFDVTRQDLVMVAQRYLSSASQCTNSIALLGPHNESFSEDKSWKVRTEQLG